MDSQGSSRARAGIYAEPILDFSNRRYIVSILSELWAFLSSRKKFWLAPIVVVMLLFGGLLILAQTSAIAPFIYTLF